MTSNPPAALVFSSILMSVPLPAILVAITTFPLLPASAIISASLRCSFAFNKSCPMSFSSKISLNSDNYTGDKIKFEEVILNLLQNAKDAVSEKTFTDSKGSIFLCAEKISDSIVISCTDNGCGISDDIVNTIFDPFVTYKTNGTGLGLALSKKIIEAHGGTLIVTSSDETGTVFTITLPV